MAFDRRQQGGNSNSNSNGGGSTSAASASASNPGSSASVSASAITSASASGASAGANATSSAPPVGITGGPGFNPNATHVSIAPNGNPGEIVFTSPSIQSTPFIKIAPSQTVVLGWNFSYVVVQPTSITVSAVCPNGNTYPVGPTNGVIPGNAPNVTWNPYDYQTRHPELPLPQAICTILIFAQGGPSAAPTPGYLAPNNQLHVGLYTTQSYIPLASGWRCDSCSGAPGRFSAHPASIALITTLLVIFLSGFTTLRRVWH